MLAIHVEEDVVCDFQERSIRTVMLLISRRHPGEEM